MRSFSQFALSQESQAALRLMGVETATSIQDLAIEPLLAGEDVIAQAPTGTGKTYAYGLPILEKCQPLAASVQALVLAPTRELAQQIGSEFTLLAQTRPWLRTAVLYGGQQLAQQIAILAKGVDIVVATPGRLLDLLTRRKLVLNQIDFCVLDEADRMLDMGFLDDVKKILNLLKPSCQIAMFSATLSREVLDISWLYQKHTQEIIATAAEQDKPDIREYYVLANGIERSQAIWDILQKEGLQRAVAFVNTKQSADILARRLSNLGLKTAALQGDLPQKQRNAVMAAFRQGSLDVLVATDVAARGLDIDDIELVFNYDLPTENENYIHRIGRTGRAGRRGLAFSFVAPGNERQFETLMQRVRSSAELYPWQAQSQAQIGLNEEDTAATIAKIRQNSGWLKAGKDKDLDPLAPPRRHSRFRSERSGSPSKRKPSAPPKQNTTKAKRRVLDK